MHNARMAMFARAARRAIPATGRRPPERRARLMPATIANMVAERPITVIPASVGRPSSPIVASTMFDASIAISATPRAMSTPWNRVFGGAPAGGGTTSGPAAAGGASATTGSGSRGAPARRPLVYLCVLPGR